MFGMEPHLPDGGPLFIVDGARALDKSRQLPHRVDGPSNSIVVIYNGDSQKSGGERSHYLFGFSLSI